MGTTFTGVVGTKFRAPIETALMEAFEDSHVFLGHFICWFKDSAPTVGADIFLGELREISRQYSGETIDFVLECDETDGPVVGQFLDGRVRARPSNLAPFDKWLAEG